MSDPGAITRAELAEALDHEIDSCYVGGRELAVNVFAYVRERRAPDLITEWAQSDSPGPVTDDTGRALPSSPERPREQSAASWRDRAEAAEAKLARIRALCRRSAAAIRVDYPDAEPPAIPVSMGSILAIIGSEEKGGAPYDRDFAGPVL